MGANESRGGSGSGNNDEDGHGDDDKYNGAIVAAGAVAGAVLAYGLSSLVSGSGSKSQSEQKEEDEKLGGGGVLIPRVGFEGKKVDDGHRLKASTELAWKPPPASTMKLNIDGSRNGSTGAIAAGGLIRNSAGDWIAGFSANLGHGDILKAELSALYHGLELAQRMQVKKLIVETDSEPVLRLLNANLELHHPLLILRNKCISCWKSSWDCNIDHVYREGNFAADYLAKVGHGMEMGTPHFFEMPPDGIIGVLQDDRDGRSRSRLI